MEVILDILFLYMSFYLIIFLKWKKEWLGKDGLEADMKLDNVRNTAPSPPYVDVSVELGTILPSLFPLGISLADVDIV